MTPLLNVEDAIAQILKHIIQNPAENVPIQDALGRVLAADIRSQVNLPPFANSSMDGYAVRHADIVHTPHRLNVMLDVPAGSFPTQAIAAGEAARIMTGAPLPPGADTIVPVEDTDSDWSAHAATLPETVEIRKYHSQGAYVRPMGENVHQGQTVLTAGNPLRPQDIGILAAIGQASVAVTRQPKIAVLTTGDELLPPHAPLTEGKIYDANSYLLAALITQLGGIPHVLPIAADNLSATQALFQAAIALQPDLIISSAGVSVGVADFVKTVLASLGEVNFWRINLRPGKPLAFGQLHSHPRSIPFFGLPGNPVSAMVTFDVIVRPALFKLLGRVDTPQTTTATVAEDFTSDGRRSYIRVTLHEEGNQTLARLTGTQSSGALFSMVLADGLLIVPEGITQVKAGDRFTVRLLR